MRKQLGVLSLGLSLTIWTLPLLAAETTFSMRPTTAAQVWETIEEESAQATLVNIWATWCQPCREEMPDLLRIQSDLRPQGFRLLLVSADFLRNQPAAESYLQGLGVTFPTLIKDQKDQEFIDGIHTSWSGALPFSILVDKEGNVVRSWEGKEDYAEFFKAIQPLLAGE